MGSEMNNFVHRIRREREKSIVPMILSDALHARANRVVLEYNSIVRRNACCAPSVIINEILAKKKIHEVDQLPISFIENNDFMSTFG